MKTGKIICLVLAASLFFAGCGKGKGKSGDASGSGQASDGGGSQSSSSGQASSGGGSVSSGDFGYRLNADKDGIVLAYYTGSGGNVVIPDTIENIPVVGIRTVFRGNTTIASVTIPATVTEIPAEAFYKCTSLSSIKWSEGLVTIGNSAFFNTGFKTIELPEGLTSIGASAFRECGALTSVKLPESLTTIGAYAFYNDLELNTLNVPAKLTTFTKSYGENNAFGTCLKLPLAIRDNLVAQGYVASEF
jgi:hypothetical protein